MANEGFFAALDKIASGVVTDAVETKKASLSEMTEMKKTLLNPTRAVTAIQTNADIAQTGALADIADLSSIDFYGKYGRTRAGAGLDNAANVRLDQTRADRNAVEIATDLGKSAIGGIGSLVSGAGGVVEAGSNYDLINGAVETATGVNPGRSIGRYLRESGNILTDAMDESRSFDRRQQDTLYNNERAVEAEDNKVEYDRDIAEGGSKLLSSLERIGRDFTDNAAAVARNPAKLGELVAESIPSLVLTGGVANAAAKASLGANASKEAIRNQAMKMVPGLIGAMEGSDTTGGIMTEIADTDDAVLQNMSPEYKAMRDEGIDEMIAKSRVASMPALQAGLVQAAIGIASGKINAGFEAAPLAKAGGLSGLARSMGLEAVEEAIQSGTQPLTTNIAMKAYIDENRDITEGVGQGIAEGALAGAGMPAALQGPGVAAGLAKPALGAAASVVSAAASPVASGVKNIAAKRDAAHTAATEAVVAEQAQTEVATASAALSENLKSPVKDEMVFDDATFESVFKGPSKDILDAVEGGRPKDVSSMFTELNKSFETAADDMSKANIADSLSAINDYIGDTIGELSAKVNDGKATAEETADLDVMRQYYDNMQGNSNIKAAKELLAERAKTVAATNQTEAQQVADAAIANPLSIPDENLDTALKIAQEGLAAEPKTELEASRKRVITGSERAVSALAGAINMKKIAKLHAIEVEAMQLSPVTNNRNTAENVSTDIVVDSFESGDGNKRSLVQYVADVTEAVKIGDIQYANDIASQLQNFQFTMADKLRALHKSAVDKGTAESYLSTSNNDFFDSEATAEGSSLTLYANNENSLKLYRMIHNDAVAVTATLNTLIEMHPELGLKPAKMPTYSKSVAQFERKFKTYANETVPTIADDLAGSVPGMPVRGPRKIGGMGDAAIEAGVDTQPPAQPGPRKTGGMSDQDIINNPVEEKPTPKAVQLKGKDSASKYLAKDQKKADKANKFIGRGSDNSSTKRYAESYGEAANSGQYAATDTVFISSEGNRKGRVEPDFAEIQKAIDAGVTFITDTAADRNGSYNLGERQVAEYLANNGYQELTDGTWTAVKAKETEAPAVTEEAPKLKLDERFPNAHKDPEGKTYLSKMFKVRKNIGQMWSSGQSVLEYLGNLYADRRMEAIEMAAPLVENFNELVAAQIAKGGYVSEAKLNAGEDLYMSGKSARYTPLLEKNEDGVWGVNQDMLNAAGIAAMEWLGKVVTTNPKSSKQVAEGLGMDEADLISGAANILNTGVNTAKAKEEIGQMIFKFWGITPSNDLRAPDAMAEQIADTMIREMVKQGYAKFENVKISDDPTVAEVLILVPTLDTNVQETLSKQYGEMTKVFTNDTDKVMYIGKPKDPKEKSKIRLNSNNVAVTPREMKSLTNQDQTKYTANMIMVDYFTQMFTQFGGFKQVGMIFGAKELSDEKDYNTNTYKTLEGKNRSIEQGIKNVMATITNVSNYAKENGLKLADVPMYFEHVINNVGRSQQLGLITPQANKIMREMMVSTVAPLDMTKDNHKLAFWLTVGQMADLKYGPEGKTKIEYLDPKIALESISTKVRSEFGNLATYFQGLEANGEMDAKGFYDAVMNQTKNKGLTPMQMHAIMALGRYDAAVAAGTEANFEHALALEADGVTNGPAGVFFKFKTDGFDQQTLEMYERVGIFFSQKQKALYQRGPKDDLYQYNSTKMAPVMQKLHQDIRATVLEKANVQPVKILSAFERLMSKYNPLGLTIDLAGETSADRWQLDRNAIKNPLTQIIYGAGVNGVANGLVKVVLDGLYADISTYIAAKNRGEKRSFSEFSGYPGNIDNDLRILFGNKFIITGGSMMMYGGDMKVFGGVKHFNIDNMSSENLQKLRFSKEQREVMATNLGTVYVQPMYNTVRNTLGTSYDVMQTFIKSSQFMNYLFKVAFNAEINNYRKENNIKVQDGLSANDMKAILKKLERFMPMVETEEQNHDLTSFGKRLDYTVTKSGKNYTRTSEPLGAKGGYAAFVNAPTDIGVSAAPNLNIGTGDGLMMVYGNAALTEKLNRILAVYDGMNMPADAIAEISSIMNEAVFKAWNTNTAKDVSDTFTSFLRGLDQAGLEQYMGFESVALDFAKILGIPTKGEWNKATKEHDVIVPKASTIIQSLEFLSTEMIENALDIQAMMDARTSLTYYTDQMAGAATPFANEGDSMAKETNILAELEARRIAARTLAYEPMTKAVEAANKRFAEGLDKFGVKIANYGVTKLKAKKLAALKGYMSNEQRTLFTRVIERSLNKSEYQILVGTSAELERFRKEVQKVQSEVAIGDGFFDPNTKTIYLANTSAETFTHELIHHALAGIIESHYNDPQSEGLVANTISNLEVLMDEFVTLNLRYDLDFDAKMEAMDDLNASLRDVESNSNLNAKQKKAAKLNEFIAWTLTNPFLAQVAATQTVRNPLVRIYKDTMKAIKKLLGLKDVDAGKDFFSQVRFNAQVLAAVNPNGSTTLAMQQAKSAVSGTRMESLHNALLASVEKRIIEIDDQGLLDEKLFNQPVKDETGEVLTILSDYGYTFTNAEATTFKMMYSSVTATDKFAPASLVQLHQIVDDVISKLKAEDFLVDPTTADDAAKAHAESLLKVVVGSDLASVNKQDLFPIFVSLAAVNDEFRNAINKIKLTKDQKTEITDMDSFLTRSTEKLIGTITDASLGTRKAGSVSSILDQLTMNMVKYQGETVLAAEQVAQTGLDTADAHLSNLLQGTSEKAYNAVKSLLVDNPDKDYVKSARNGAVNSVRAILSLGSKNAGQDMGNAITGITNAEGFPVAVRNLFSSIRGFTDTTTELYRKMNKVKSRIQGARQEYRSVVPTMLEAEFKTKLTKIHKAALHAGIGRTGLSDLIGTFDLVQIKEMLTDSKKLDKALAEQSQGVSSEKLNAAKDLAKYIVRDEGSTNLHLNAYAISENFAGKGTEQQIDDIVSLLAIKELSESTRTVLSELVTNDANGIDSMLKYHAYLRKRENNKHQTNVVKLNQKKGYIPSEATAGTGIQVVDQKQRAKLEKLGWIYEGPYVGSNVDSKRSGQIVMRSESNNMARYTQGILQTAERSQNGVDVLTGRQVGAAKTGIITGEYAKEITRRLRNKPEQAANGEFLRPIYGEKRNIVAYEQLVNPALLVHLRKDTDAFTMTGAWAGRQVEEQLVQRFNEETVDELHRLYMNPKAATKGEFENIAKSTDKIYADSWDNISRETREYIKKKFGKADFLPIRRDMIENSVGYRNATVADVWSGATRMNPAVMETAKASLVAVFGQTAYAKMVKSERVLQTGVSSIKDLIIVRSLIVPFGNLVSNVWQLSTRGVPLSTIAKMAPKVFAETTQYLKNKEAGITLQYELNTTSDPVEQRRIKSRINTLLAMNAKMSIAPLIEAGEFTTVAEGMTEMDASLTNGRIAEWVEAKVDAMPTGVKEFARQGLLLRDTALYKGLDRMTQYGDFISKAIYYHHLTEQKKVDKNDALVKITQEFINYNLLSGRSQDYLESIGMAWFWKFKLRAASVAVDMIQNNPFRVFLHTAGVPFTDLTDFNPGNIVEDNFLMKTLEGGAGYSIGPGMGLGAVSLNPWVNGIDWLLGR